MNDDPLILTLALDDATQEWFDAQRRAYFPPARNVLSAHLTLFHHLPAAHGAALDADLAELCAAQPPPTLTVTGVRFLGRGVAYVVDSPVLSALHGELARRWWPWLGTQDRQPFRAHVTVQNKAAPSEARALYDNLRDGFAPLAATGTGLQLWRYLGGPWEPVAEYPFASSGESGAA